MNIVIDGVSGIWTPEERKAKPSRFSWSDRSIKRMGKVHRDLVLVMEEAIRITPVDLTVLEGRRSIERQKKLVASGASQTMNSRHITGHAVDVAPINEDGAVAWDWPLYHQIAPAIKEAALVVGVPIHWGGDWETFRDGPHWELPWQEYPA